MRDQHTPGPWETQSMSTRVRGPEGVLICTTATSRKHSVIPVLQQVGNAQLIAAAPELLAACREQLSIIEESGLVSEHADNLVRLRAAIAKATGGQ